MIKRLLILTLSLAMAAATLSATAQGYTPRTVPNVQLADARQFVSNPDGVLSPATTAEINRMCLDLRNRNLAEVVVLVLDSVDEGSLDMFAHNVLNLWGVGRKGANNGLVISVVRRQRDIQFETGYGLEGVLPDAICKRIQTVYMIPPLREGNWDEGVLAGVRAVYNVLTGNEAELSALAASRGTGGEGGGSAGALLMMFLFFGIFILFIVIAAVGRRKRGGKNFDDDDFGGRGGPGGGIGGSLLGGILGGLLGGSMGRGGGGGFGGGFGGGMSGGGGSRSGF